MRSSIPSNFYYNPPLAWVLPEKKISIMPIADLKIFRPILSEGAERATPQIGILFTGCWVRIKFYPLSERISPESKYKEGWGLIDTGATVTQITEDVAIFLGLNVEQK